jgi:hypothetical protein
LFLVPDLVTGRFELSPIDPECLNSALAFIDRIDRDQHSYIDRVHLIAAGLSSRYDRLPGRNLPLSRVIEVERAWRAIPITSCTVDQVIERHRRRLQIRDVRVASGNMAPLRGQLGSPGEPAAVLCCTTLTIDRQGYRIETPPIAYFGMHAIARWFQRHAVGAEEDRLIADIAALLDVSPPTTDMLGDTLDIVLSDGVWRTLASTIYEPSDAPIVGLAVKKWLECTPETAH